MQPVTPARMIRSGGCNKNLHHATRNLQPSLNLPDFVIQAGLELGTLNPKPGTCNPKQLETLNCEL